jgi:protein-L-isoaspartate(D-aspartate) O-methyltransferase
MVETQLKARGIRNKAVLHAMSTIPREQFIPEDRRYLAYGDHPVPIGKEQTISQPYIVAYMTEAINPNPRFKVLEIGTGSGYQAAVLAAVVAEVYTIEIIEDLAVRAKSTLIGLGYENIHFRIGDGYAGWEEAGPFDAILLTAAPPKLPEPLLEQLAIGGVLIAPVGVDIQRLLRVTRDVEGYSYKEVMGVRFVPMTGEAQLKK